MTVLYFLYFCIFSMCMEMINSAHEIILERIENALDDDKFVTFEGLRVKKFNRTIFVVSGKYNLKMSLDDEIDIKVEAFNFQGGQYKKMVEKQLNQFCTTLYIDAFKEAHSVFYEASSLQVPFYTCPFPAGENEITNLMIDEKGMLPPYIPGGEKWRIDVRFLKNAEVLGGYNVYGLIRSDESLLKGG